MPHESQISVIQASFNPRDPSALLSLVKDLIALANSGGGLVVFGKSETGSTGLDPDTAAQLDTTPLTELADSFIQPASLDLSHTTEKLADGQMVVTIEVAASPYPIVIARPGTWDEYDPAADRPVFHKGDIWVRHGDKTANAGYADFKTWIDSARQLERTQITERLTALVNLPEGTELRVVSPSGLSIDSPVLLIESARVRRAQDPDHLLGPDDLLWVFRQREALELLEADLELLIASALRRSATLYWWLIQADRDRALILQELAAVFEASDRDKSDAASSILELGSLYANDQVLGALIENLRGSRYKHFRQAAQNWPGREQTTANLAARLSSAKHNRRHLTMYTLDELENLATVLAQELTESRSGAMSRKLSDVTRMIWAKNTPLGQEIIQSTDSQPPLLSSEN